MFRVQIEGIKGIGVGFTLAAESESQVMAEHKEESEVDEGEKFQGKK